MTDIYFYTPSHNTVPSNRCKGWNQLKSVLGCAEANNYLEVAICIVGENKPVHFEMNGKNVRRILKINF